MGLLFIYPRGLPRQPSPNISNHRQISLNIANGTPTWLFLTSRMLRIIDCPDCCPGLTIAVIAAWLSVYRTHLVYSGLSLTISVASLMAHNSAAYTLYEVSFPRYW